mmetsp:Transcript_83550/g.233173  ORF Transcript_83550/g.233173 Transcript_83550/m.233173 type:complete len:262 (+) Transcript_83550:51-836(+)
MCDASTWLTCLHPRRYTRAKANAAKEPSTTHKLEAAHQKGISTRRSFKRLSIFLRRGMLNIAPSTSTDKDEAAAAHRIDSATVFLSPYLAPTNEPRKQSPAPVVSRTVPSGVASLKAPILISPGNKPDSPSDSLALQSPPKYIEPKLPRVTRTSISALPAAANFSRNAATASRTSGFFGTSPLCVLTPAMKVSSLLVGCDDCEERQKRVVERRVGAPDVHDDGFSQLACHSRHLHVDVLGHLALQHHGHALRNRRSKPWAF